MDYPEIDAALAEGYAELNKTHPLPTRDQIAQMRPNSTNACPNSKPRRALEMTACDSAALTTWGYCNECWLHDRVPADWAHRVRQELMRRAAQ